MADDTGRNGGACAGGPGGSCGCTARWVLVALAVGVVVAARWRLVDLGVSKCILRKMMTPILEEMRKTLAAELDVQFVDVWENPDAGKQYGFRLIPTQIFFDPAGKKLFRHEGFFSREDILAKWKDLEFAIGSTNAVPAG